MGFSRAQLLAFRDATVDDLVGPGLKLLFVGINPGLWTAATGAHFARPGNRFYPALAAAGITEYRIRAGDGMSETDRRHLTERGVGITNIVARATARADELSPAELQLGASRLEERVGDWRPAVVAIAGVTAYRHAFGRTKAAVGRQPERLTGAELWVVPNPSGLNAHSDLAALAAAYAEPARAAGVVA
jgi:TDG/mug DNA glycosylase family protein